MIACTVIGNLGQDAEVKNVGQTSVCEFSVASTEKRKDGEVSTWVRCQFWGDRGAKLSQYLTKGNQIAVRGSLSAREFTDKNGAKRTSLECRVDDIKLLGKRDNANASNGTSGKATPRGAGDAYEAADPADDFGF